MSTDPQKQEITISIRNEADEAVGGSPAVFTGKRTISAFAYSGTLAIFLDSIGKQEWWIVTHIPTGLRLMGVRGKRQNAERVIDILLKADWGFGTFGSQSLLELVSEETRQVFLQAWEEAKALSAAAALGRLGGRSKSLEKAQAARENGKKGGRPKQHRDTSAFD